MAIIGRSYARRDWRTPPARLLRPVVGRWSRTSWFVALLFALLLVVTVLLLEWTSGYARDEIESNLSVIARTSISLIDRSMIARVAAAPGNTELPDYSALRADLRRVRDSAPEVRFVYLLGRRDREFIFLVDAEPEASPSYSPPGEVLGSVDADNVRGVVRAIETRQLTIAGPYGDRYGHWVSALTPILDDAGRTIAVLGIDVPAEHWDRQIRRYRGFGLLISGLTAAIVLLAVFLLLVEDGSKRKLRVEVARQARLERKLRNLSELDSLTRIANRRRLEEYLSAEWSRAEATGGVVAVLMADIDKFKAYNDRYGHAAGDQVLSMVARTMARLMRSEDLVARYGGEEFVVVLPGLGDSSASRVAERMRSEVYALNCPHIDSPEGRLTVSIGIATAATSDVDDAWALLCAADRSLYVAKAHGGNLVVGPSSTGRTALLPFGER